MDSDLEIIIERSDNPHLMSLSYQLSLNVYNAKTKQEALIEARKQIILEMENLGMLSFEGAILEKEKLKG